MGWIAGRQYRQKITIQEGNVFDDHTDFPVAIKISGANDIFTKAQADGYDILFATDSEEPLSYERVRWDPGSQILFVYVKTDLSSSEATVFYMYYGNGGNTITVDGQNKYGTWNSNFHAVYHFEEASGNLQDSTSNARHSDSNNQVKYHYAGLHSYACYFDGSGDYFTFNGSTGWVFTGNTARAITAYFYPQAAYNTMGSWESLIRWSGPGGGSRREYMLSLDNAGECSPSESVGIHYWGSNTCTGKRVVTGGEGILTSTWHQYAGRHDSSQPRQYVYIDGDLLGQSTYTLDTYDGVGYIGKRDSDGQNFHGRLSEIRLYNTDIGGAWIQTEYENMINNDTFFTLGAEEDTPYLLTDVPTVFSIIEEDDASRNILTEFSLTSTATIYDDWPTEISLADFANTISGADNIDVELVTSFSGILTGAELDNQIDFIISASGILISTVRDTINDFTVAKQPVPITDPYGGTDVAVDYIQGHIVTPSGYGIDIDNELGIGTAYDAGDDQDVEFAIATFDIFTYLADIYNSTVSGTYGYPAYRQRITISGSKIEDDLVDFPLAVHIDDVANPIFIRAKDSGADIKFKKDGNWLSHELVNFSKADFELLAYVKCTLSSGIDYSFHMYYGDYGEIEDAYSVWNDDYEIVYHFQQAPPNDTVNSAKSTNDALPVNMESGDSVDGFLGAKVLRFDGSNEDLAVRDLYYNTPGELEEITIEAIIKTDSTSEYRIIASWDRSASFRFTVGDDTLGGYYGYIGWDTEDETDVVHDMQGNTLINNNTFRYVAASYESFPAATGLKRIYVDGDIDAEETAHGTNRGLVESGGEIPRYGFIGVGSEAGSFNGTRGPLNYFEGDIAEFRLTYAARSPGWIKTTYNNLMDNSNFFSELGVDEEFTTCGGLGDNDHPSHWCLANYLDTEVTISGGRVWPIETDIYASVSGTQFNFDTDLYVSLANTISGTVYEDGLVPLISGSYFNSDITISGALGYPVETDIYVSLANSFTGQVPVPPSGNHTSDYTVISGSYFNTDMRLHALQIDNFFLDIDEYTDASDTMSVDITDLRFIEIDTSDCYFIINGVPVTSGIVFDPISRPTASGFTMSYDPPTDFFAEEPIEVIVHAENVINDVLEETYYLLYGYNLVVDKPGVSYGWDKDVVIWSTATNTASCPASSTDGWTIRTASQPYKDLGATITPQVKHKDLSAVIYPISTAIFYGNRYKITVRAKDLAGNEMPPFILDLTIEDKPN